MTQSNSVRWESTSWTPLPLYGCLLEAETRLGKDRQWSGPTAEHERFLLDYFQGLSDSKAFGTNQFQTKFAETAEVLNHWFETNGFSIKLDEFPPGAVGTGAIVLLASEWEVAGSTIPNFSLDNETSTPGVTLSQGWEAYYSDAHPNPIGAIRTKSGVIWHITKATKPLSGLDLYDHVKQIERGVASYKTAGVLKFPKIDFEQHLQPSPVIGLQTVDLEGNQWQVAQCAQQTMIQANHKGGVAKSAAGMMIRATSFIPMELPLNINIDGPCYLWITHPDAELPIFTAQLAYDAFADPGELDFEAQIKG